MLILEFDLVKNMSDKTSVSYEKVNIMVYILICCISGTYLSCLCFYIKIRFDRDFAPSLVYGQLEMADTGKKVKKQTHTHREKVRSKLFAMRADFGLFLAPNKQDAAGSLVILVPPSVPTCSI